MSEYWWSWKLHRVPFSTSLQWRMGWGEGRVWVSMERGTFLNIQNPSVLCRVSKGDQSHFEALGASFVCEGCEVLPKWLCQFFKTHLQLTLGASAFIVFWGSSWQTHDWLQPTFYRLAQDKDLSTWKSYLLLDRTPVLRRSENRTVKDTEQRLEGNLVVGNKICNKYVRSAEDTTIVSSVSLFWSWKREKIILGD